MFVVPVMFPGKNYSFFSKSIFLFQSFWLPTNQCLCPRSCEYRKDVLYPVLQAAARKAGQGDFYMGLISDSDPLIIPSGVSEMEIKRLQVLLISTGVFGECVNLKVKLLQYPLLTCDCRYFCALFRSYVKCLVVYFIFYVTVLSFFFISFIRFWWIFMFYDWWLLISFSDY